MVYGYQVGGNLPADAPNYVERSADQALYERLLRGDYCYIFNSRQMGKSSLRVRTMVRLQQAGVACAVIDPQRIGVNVREEQWFATAIQGLVKDFGLQGAFDFRQWWRSFDELSTLVQRFTCFLEEELLQRLEQPVVIFIEEIDRLRSAKFSTDDLMSGIRGLCENRSQNPDLQRLTFALVGVTTPGELIRDRNLSRFNIGTAIELEGFRFEEAQPLLAGLEGKVADPQAVLRAVLDWTGGQPFLTQKLLAILVQAMEVGEGPELAGLSVQDWVARLVRERVLENWEAQDAPQHLGTLQDRMLAIEEQGRGRLLGLYQQVLDGSGVAADERLEQMQLRLTGLVVKRGGRLQVYNPIYGAIFNADWVVRHLNELRPGFYGEALRGWLASGEQDAGFLLRRQPLREAEDWAKGKRLSGEDERFLQASREEELVEQERALAVERLQKEEKEKALAAEKQRRELLEDAQMVANQRIRWGSLILVGTVVVSLGATTWGAVATKRGQEANKQLMLSTQKVDKQERLADEARQENRRITAQNDQLGISNKALASQKRLLEEQAKEVNQDLESALQEKQRAIEQTQIAQSNAEGAEQDLLEANNNLAEAERKAQGAEAEAEAAIQEVQKAKKNTIQAKQQLNKIQQELQMAVQEANKSEKILDEVNRTLQAVRVQVGAEKSLAEALAGKQLLALLQGIRTGRVFQKIEEPLLESQSKIRKEWLRAKFQTQAALTIIHKIRERNILTSHQGLVYRVNFSSDGRTIVSGSSDGMIKLWDIDGSERATPVDYLGGVTSMNVSPDGKTIVSGGFDGVVKLWNIDGSERATLTGHRGTIFSVRFSPDGQLIASSDGYRTIKLWNVDGSELATFADNLDIVFSVDFSPDGQLIASGELDGTVKLWNVNGSELAAIDSLAGWIFSVDFSPDGNMLVSAGHNGMVKLWNVSSIRKAGLIESTNLRDYGTLANHKGRAYSANFSPDGSMVVSGGEDGMVRLWNVRHCGAAELTECANLEEYATLRGHQGTVYSVNFSPDGSMVASAGKDGTVKLWNVHSLEQVSSKDNPGLGYGMELDSKSSPIIFKNSDETAKLTTWDIDQLLNLACDWASDYLRTNPDVSDEDRALCGIAPRQEGN